MGYTVEEANQALRKIVSGEAPATMEELRRIIDELDVSDNYAIAGAKTVLYSGSDVADLLEGLDSSRGVRILDHTEAFKFLNKISTNEDFANAWLEVTGEEIDEDAFKNYNSKDKWGQVIIILVTSAWKQNTL